MSSAKRLFNCTLSDLAACSVKKGRQIGEYQTPVLPRNLRGKQSNFSSLDADEIVTTPPLQISPNLYLCAICLGIPRVPAQITRCGHIGCMHCLLRHIKMSTSRNDSWALQRTATCPLCRAEIDEDMLKVYADWQPLTKAVFGLLKTSCTLNDKSLPVKCSWIGAIMDLSQHENYNCPLRLIQCPNRSCPVVDHEFNLQEHYKTCCHLEVRCLKCCLPMRWESRNTHSCKQALKAAVQGKSKTDAVAHLSDVLIHPFLFTQDLEGNWIWLASMFLWIYR